MIKKVIQIGDPILRTKSKNITLDNIGTSKINKLITDLTDTMRATNLVGIAAPQIGINLNIFLVEIRNTKFREQKHNLKLEVFINPKIIKYSANKTLLIEGCGSINNADLFGPVNRPSMITVEALNAQGIKFQKDYSGLFAKVIQHEHDHLQGVLCLDKFTNTRLVTNQVNYKKLIINK